MIRKAATFFIIFLFGAGGTYFLMRAETKQIDTPEEPKVGNISDAKGAVVLTEVPFVANDTLKQNFPEDKLSVNATFPKIVLPHQAAYEAQTNDVLRAVVMEEIDHFRTIAKEESDNKFIPKDAASDITINYTTLLLSPSIVSFRFNISAYGRGAAHPDNYSRIVNYDIPGHIVRNTADLFLRGTTYLTLLSSETRDVLLERCVDCDDFGRSMIATGTEPVKENFTRVGIVPEGLIVIFDPYQIAPYARGSQEVVIPITALKNVVKAEVIEAIKTSAPPTIKTD
jgi:hypothetical protein